ncbi:hypothetical protein [Salinicola rhizosphaerae]|uniref:DUF4381 domain-containing protein n=1 Tax=Salinicola rhizosphaerae TaxID=1443141 RepID=A0ABQ3DWL1_9GAMM|nr:hypothetical protein [Salinicola rhizosphaerae]GHB16169.1 hypothetical protein GCM10009038_13270 [Salinicola rhizosphaerae]
MKSGLSIALIVVVLLATAAGGMLASDLAWPLPTQALAPLGLYLLALVLAGWLCVQLIILTRGLGQQQQALQESQRAVQRQLESAELSQLMGQFVQHAETLLEKESLDPNKRNVMRCLAVDALRGNTGRGDVNYTRLARLFEWLNTEAQRHEQDAHRLQLMRPTLMQYAETAAQLCRVGESQPEKLGRFLAHQSTSPKPDAD